VGGGDVELQRRAVTEIVNALMELSRKRIGALIVIRRQTGLEDVLESGTRLDAEISAALLENIFEPNTPLHDGAVIVEDLRISAAACILQLTDDISLSRELGTRHRAAIGVTETTDAVTLIVSEETGIISTARDGRLTRYLDRKALTTLLTGLLVSEEIPLKQRIEGLLTRRKENKHEKD
jgi:diadenylate cyclase